MTTALCKWGNYLLNLINSSTLDDTNENGKGDYVLIDSKTLKVTLKGFVQGGWIVKLDVDTVNGGMKLDRDFPVDFGKEPNGPVLPHKMRYPEEEIRLQTYG